jgi:hypothetical protein
MPIRLNLLSEAQALEDMRRKDPVKRVLWAGVLCVALLLVWSSSLQVRALVAKGEVGRVEGDIASLTNDYGVVVVNQKKLAEANQRLAALRQLATNRFLNGSVLNALQQTIVDDVCLTRIRTEQNYTVVEPTKASTNKLHQVVAGKPGKATERIVIYLEGKDSAPVLGDQVPRFKNTISSQPYIEQLLGKTNEVRLASMSPPSTVGTAKPFVAFSLECRLPERTR